MVKKSKFWLPMIGIASAFALIPAVIVSCSRNSSTISQQYVTSDIGGLNSTFNSTNVAGDNVNHKLVEKVKEIRQGGDQAKKDLLDQRVILITTGGKTNDKSFNQSVWEAVSKFSNEIGSDQNAYYENSVIDQATQSSSYDYAIAKKFKIWILTGFQQESLLLQWLSVGNNLKRFTENDTFVITVDWFTSDKSDNPTIQTILDTIKGRVLGLNFKTQQGGFTMGYAASKLVQEIDADLKRGVTDPNKLTPQQRAFESGKTWFNAFGGGDFAGVTNFNYGFYEGMRQFNEENSQVTDAANKYFIKASPTDLTTGFAIDNDSKQKVFAQVDGHLENGKNVRPQIVFPVAGSLTSVAIDRINNKNSNLPKSQSQWVVGVDTDQSLAFEADKGIMLTSVEKRIAIATYKALLTVFGLTDYDSANNTDKTTNLLDGSGYTINKRKIVKDGVAANFNSIGGYKEGFVGVSKSTLDENVFKFNKDNKSYAKRFDEIVVETWKKFFGEGDQKGLLEKDKSESGLFDQDLLTAFDAATKDWGDHIKETNGNPTQAKIDEIKPKILALKNPFFGYMTSADKPIYFDPIIDYINNNFK